MAGATRASRALQQQQQQQRVVPPSSPPAQLSSSATVCNETTQHRTSNSTGYVTLAKTETQSPCTERVQLSQTPLPLRQPSERRTVSATTAVCDEAGLLGIHLKEVIEVISRLEGLGLQQQNIQLPKCVVLGEQSSGKSSVIEALSGVRTPRAGGTCTRCPLFIRLICSSDPQVCWSARVTLRYNYTFDPLARGKFPGWLPNHNVQEVEFATCGSPNELEEAIRRAQLALVHPLEDWSLFAPPRIVSPLDPDQGHVVNFSPNIVCIDVAHPTLPNLSFYDLPGLISQSENPGDVPLVKQLVKDYVQDPDALVLVACSLAADIATCMASGYARNEWGAGGRCVGVLTKPDLLPVGSSDAPLQKVLNNIELRFQHGYFVVKNPDQLMLNNRLSHKDAREQERQFFATTQPWCSSLQAYQARFGTANLQQYLSEQLAGQMVKALPIIYDQINVRLNELDDELEQIPEPPPSHSAVRIIFDLLNAFSEHIRKELEAEYPYKNWKSLWSKIQQRFMDDLFAMRPTMRTIGQLDYGVYTSTLRGQSSDDPMCVDDNDDSMDTHDTPPETPQKKRKVENTPASTPTRAPRLTRRGTSTPSKPAITGIKYIDKGISYQLDKVSEHFKENSKSKIHDQLQPMVVNDMIKHTLRNWRIPLEKFFDELERELKGYVRQIFDIYFRTRSDTKLYADAWRIVEDMFNASMAEQRYTLAVDALNNELDGPYIFHEKKFDDAKEAMHQKYCGARFNSRLRIYMDEMAEHMGRDRVPSEERLRKDNRVRNVLTKDPYHKEIDVIARITSYYQLAADRFHDVVCMSIEGKFFKRLRTRLRDEMDDTLGIHNTADGAQKAMELLAEPSHHADRRRQLMAMKNALLEGQRHLDELQAKHGNSINASHLSSGYTPLPLNSSASFGLTSTLVADEMKSIAQSRR